MRAMQEFETKFTGYSLSSAQKLLHNNGYKCTKPEQLMLRKSFHVTGHRQKWVRVRDDGGKITLTIKEITIYTGNKTRDLG